MKVNTNRAELVISAVQKAQYPSTVFPEIAMAGRSNVGKSSLINKVLNRRNFAYVSATPGKTATINFYNIDNQLMLVDLPGYGFASKAKNEIKTWGGMIGEYINDRPQLMQVILLVDARHKPSADDISMMRWIRSRFDYAVVFATKSDKLSKSQLEQNLEMIVETLDLQNGDILIPFSVKGEESAENFWEYIYGCVLDDEEEED